jgi:hypothetical protein
MTAGGRPEPGTGPAGAHGPAGQHPRGWRTARQELAAAAAAVIATAGAAYAWDGSAAAAVVLAVAALVGLVVVRTLTEPVRLPALPQSEWQATGRSVITGFWRKRSMVGDATAAGGNYDYELRPTLQHLLAARLADRHGVSLYAEPGRARELFAGKRHDDLWPWVDPARLAAPDSRGGGIPARTLAAIIDRLEQL